MPIANYYWKDVKTLALELIYNFTQRNNSAVFQQMNNAITKNLDEAVEFTVRNVHNYISFMPSKNIEFLKGKTLLEIGPGQDFGIALVLADLGLEKVILLDPFLIPWNDEFHVTFYKKLLISVEEKFPSIDFESLKEVIQTKSHQTKKLSCHSVGIGFASDIASNSIDISISNACLEHFVNPEKALTELARITKQKGIGFHQIDLRDHRNYDMPLEFLQIPELLFNKIKKITLARFGNRLRYSEYVHLFNKTGFEVEFRPDNYADEVYLNNILKRSIAHYKAMSVEEFSCLGGRFFIKKRNLK